MDSRDKFAQMLTEGYKALDPDREEREYIRELLRQREQQRKKRIRTITALAAAFLIVIGAVFAVGGCIGPVEADKNDRTKVEKQGESVIISDENADGQEVMSETARTTDWNKVDKLKDKYPEMITFTDIPEGLEFVSVEVVNSKNVSFDVTYSYLKGENEVFVCQRIWKHSEQNTQIMERTKDIITFNGYEVAISNENGVKEASLTIENETINIIGNISNSEIVEILDKIKSF